MQTVRMAREEEGRENEDVPLEGFRFFLPSTELTEAIKEQNQQLVSEYVKRNFPPGYQDDDAKSAVEDGSLLGRLASEISRPDNAVETGRRIRKDKQLISERLYHYLSSLAETPTALEDNDFLIWEYIPDAMATMLGLSAYRDMPPDSAQAIEIRRLLDTLTSEFRNWLLEVHHGTFVTPWLKIDLTNQDALRLSATEESNASSSNAASLDSELEWAVAQVNASEDTVQQTEDDDQSASAVSAT